jgi:Rhodopirellula transposase DDE domain
MEIVEQIRSKFSALAPVLNERGQRLWAAAEARALGRGGISRVSEATGISHVTIRHGVAELASGPQEIVTPHRSREAGGGRRKATAADPTLMADLLSLVESATRGDPESPLLWTSKSVRRLAVELGRKGHRVAPQTVANLLHEAKYSLQANRKTKEGASHPDRNEQFEYISRQVKYWQARGEPVISVDTKKKELVGEFKNGGQEWRPAGSPEKVLVHDFADPELGKVVPYGVYDLARNSGWVSVGTDHDTAQFAVQTIRLWWRRMGRPMYPRAKGLLVTADGGGSNGSRSRLWKVELQRFSSESGLRVEVCHFPPGTSKWNKIEHRMFCHITENWRGRPLTSCEVIVNLIAATKTAAGLRVKAALDEHEYPTGLRIADEDLAAVHLKPSKFHGEWNYTIAP